MIEDDLTQRVIELERRVETLEKSKSKQLSVNVQDYSDVIARLIRDELKRMAIPRGIA